MSCTGCHILRCDIETNERRHRDELHKANIREQALIKRGNEYADEVTRLADRAEKIDGIKTLVESWIAECKADRAAHEHDDPLCPVCVGSRAVQKQLTQLLEHLT